MERVKNGDKFGLYLNISIDHFGLRWVGFIFIFGLGVFGDGTFFNKNYFRRDWIRLDTRADSN